MNLVKSKWHGKGKGIRGETSHTFQQKNNQILPWRCAYQKACISCGPLSHGLPRKNGKNPPMQEKSRRFSGAGAMQEKWSKTRRLLRNAGDLTGLELHSPVPWHYFGSYLPRNAMPGSYLPLWTVLQELISQNKVTTH